MRQYLGAKSYFIVSYDIVIWEERWMTNFFLYQLAFSVNIYANLKLSFLLSLL